MLASDLELVDIDRRHWANWLELLTPPGVLNDPRWAAVFIDESGSVRKAVANERGAIDPVQVPFTGTSAEEMEQLAGVLEVGALVVLTMDAAAQLHQEIDGNLSLGDDYVAQGLTILRALKKLSGAGLWVEPRVLDIIPTPPFDALQKTFDVLIPNKSSMLVYVFADDGSRIKTSIIATKLDGHVDTATTHLGIADLVPEHELAPSWRSSNKRVLNAVDQRFAKPCIGVFIDETTWYKIVTGPTDTLTRELSARNIIIDPAPAWLLGLLGGATVAALASRSARALAKLLPASARKMASDLAHQAQDVVRDSGAHPFALLGFDPIELWLSVRHLYRRPTKPAAGVE